MAINDDEINTNAEYEPVERLDDIVDKEGEPIDPIEQNQSEDDYAGEGGARDELRQAINGDRETKDDE